MRRRDAAARPCSAADGTAGYKEFAAFLAHCDSGSANDAEGQRLFAHALERMQIGTRQYAKYQTKWIRNTFAPEVAEADDVAFYLLDATGQSRLRALRGVRAHGSHADLSKWKEDVGGPAVELVTSELRSGEGQAQFAHAAATEFLNNEPLPDARGLSAAAASQLPQAPRSLADPLGRNAMEVCTVCTKDATAPVLVRRSEMQAHVQTRAHRLASRSTQRAPHDPEVVARKREERRRMREGTQLAQTGETQ